MTFITFRRTICKASRKMTASVSVSYTHLDVYKRQEKIKYLFNCPSGGALYLAGLYNDYGDERRMVILTTAANKSVSDIHNRMPVVLSDNELADWVGNPNRALEILHRPGPLLEKVAVS